MANKEFVVGLKIESNTTDLVKANDSIKEIAETLDSAGQKIKNLDFSGFDGKEIDRINKEISLLDSALSGLSTSFYEISRAASTAEEFFEKFEQSAFALNSNIVVLADSAKTAVKNMGEIGIRPNDIPVDIFEAINAGLEELNENTTANGANQLILAFDEMGESAKGTSKIFEVLSNISSELLGAFAALEDEIWGHSLAPAMNELYAIAGLVVAGFGELVFWALELPTLFSLLGKGVQLVGDGFSFLYEKVEGVFSIFKRYDDLPLEVFEAVNDHLEMINANSKPEDIKNLIIAFEDLSQEAGLTAGSLEYLESSLMSIKPEDVPIEVFEQVNAELEKLNSNVSNQNPNQLIIALDDLSESSSNSVAAFGSLSEASKVLKSDFAAVEDELIGHSLVPATFLLIEACGLAWTGFKKLGSGARDLLKDFISLEDEIWTHSLGPAIESLSDSSDKASAGFIKLGKSSLETLASFIDLEDQIWIHSLNPALEECGKISDRTGDSFKDLGDAANISQLEDLEKTLKSIDAIDVSLGTEGLTGDIAASNAELEKANMQIAKLKADLQEAEPSIFWIIMQELDELEERLISSSFESIALIKDEDVNVWRTLTTQMDKLNEKEKELKSNIFGMIQGFLQLLGIFGGLKTASFLFNNLVLRASWFHKAVDQIRDRFLAIGPTIKRWASNLLGSLSEIRFGFQNGLIPGIINLGKMGVAAFQSIGIAVLNVAKKIPFLDTAIAKITPILQVIGQQASIAFHSFIKAERSMPIIARLLTMLGVAEIGFGALGAATDGSSAAIGSFINTAGVAGAVATGALAFGIKSLINYFGDLAITIGSDVLQAFDDYGRKAEQVIADTKQYEFVVNNFSSMFGKELVGSVEYWNEVLEEVSENSSLSMGDIKKSISLLVKESSVLGFSADQMAAVIRRSVDVAANSNMTLFDTTQRLISGFAGMAQSALALGVDMRQQTIQHGTLAAAIDDHNNKASQFELNQMRLNAFMEQTVPILGSAELKMQSLKGMTEKLSASLETLRTNFYGGSLIATIKTKVMSRLVSVLNLVPERLLQIAGQATQVGSAFLVVIGYLIKMTTTVFFAVVAFKTINYIMITNVAIQAKATAASATLGAAVGAQTVAVTGLGAAWVNMTAIIKASLLAAWVQLNSVLVAAGAIIAGILPWLVAIGAVAASIFTAVDAAKSAFHGWGQVLQDTLIPIKQMIFETFGLSSNIEELNTGAKETQTLFDRIKTTFISTVQAAIIPFMLAVNQTARGLILFKIAFTENTESLQELSNALDRNISSTERLEKQLYIAKAGVLSFGDAEDMAAANSDILAYEAEKASGGINSIGIEARHAAKDLGDLSEKMAEAVQDIKKLEGEIFAATASKVDQLDYAQKKRIEEIELLEQTLKTEGKLSKERAAQLSQLKGLVQAANQIKIEEMSKSEINKIQKENLNLEREISTAGLENLDRTKAQLEYSISDLETKRLSLKAEKLLTPELDSQISKQIKLLNLKKEGLGVDAKATASTGGAPRGPRKSADTGEKLTDAQRELNTLLGEGENLTKKIRDFGKDQITIIKNRLADRLKEIGILKQQLSIEGNLTAEKEAGILAAIVNEKKLATLEIQEQIKQKSEEIRGIEERLSTSLIASDTEIARLTKGKIQLLVAEVWEKHRALKVDEEKLLSEGKLTAQMKRTFSQLRQNNIEAGKFAIREAKTEAITQLKNDVQQLEISGLNQEEQAQRKLELELAAVDAKKLQLQKDGLLTAEANKLIKRKKELIAKQGETSAMPDLKEMGLDIAEGIVDGAQSLKDDLFAMFDSFSQLGQEGGSTALVKSFEKIPEYLVQGMEMFPLVIEKSLTSFLNAFSQMIAKMPEMLAKFGEMIPVFIDKINEVLLQLFASLPGLFSQIMDMLLPALNQIFQKLPELILSAFNSIGDMAVIFIQKIPEMVTIFAENIGPIVEAFTEGLVTNIGKVAIALVDELIVKGGIVKMSLELAKAFGWDLPIAFVKGVYNGLKNIWDAIIGGAKIPLEVPPAISELPQKISGAVEQVAEGIKAGGSDVFAVLDVQKVKSARSMDKSIGDATKRAAAAFKNTFKTIGGWLEKLWAKLKEVWLWVWQKLTWLWDELTGIWRVVWEQLSRLWERVKVIFDQVLAWLSAIWDAVWSAFNTVLGWLKSIWDTVWQMFDQYLTWLKSIWDSVWSAFNSAVESLQNAINRLFEFLGSLPNKFSEAVGHLWSALNSIPGKFIDGANQVLGKFGEIGNTVKNQVQSALDQVNPANLLGKAFSFSGGGMGKIENLLNMDFPWASFADGGMVPGVASLPGDNKKNDTVAALLSPGEAVIPRSAMADPEIARLVNAIIDGNVKFAFGGFKAPKISVSAPKIPSMNDIKDSFSGLSTNQIVDKLDEAYDYLKTLSTGDLWGMFKDTAINALRDGLVNHIKRLASFDTGGIIPNDGIAMVHKSEAVLPADLVSKIMGNSQGGGSIQNITLNATVNVGDQGATGKVSGKKIIDEMFAELRKRSRNGKVMFETGLIK